MAGLTHGSETREDTSRVQSLGPRVLGLLGFIFPPTTNGKSPLFYHPVLEVSRGPRVLKRPTDGLLSPRSADCRDTVVHTHPCSQGALYQSGRHAIKSSHKRGALGGLVWPGKLGKATRRKGYAGQGQERRESVPGQD